MHFYLYRSSKDNPRYDFNPVNKRLGLKDRFDVTWYNVMEAFDREKARLLADIGLRRSNADMRMLEPPEWNLIANREGWGLTLGDLPTGEWTNAEYRGYGDSRCLVVGNSVYGGAAHVDSVRFENSHPSVGFRAAIVLGS